MSLFTSPLFVFLFMTAPLWLGILAHFTRNNRAVSRTLWAYAALILILDFFTYSSSTQLVFWTSLFSGGGLWLFPCSAVIAYLENKKSNNSTTTAGFVFSFLFFTLVLWVIVLLVPSVYHSIVGFFQSIGAMFHNLAAPPVKP